MSAGVERGGRSDMEHVYIMNAFGKDRPGVVADVSRLIFECGGNLEDSAMTRLEDEFAIILLFSVESENAGDPLLNDCRRLEKEKGVSAFFSAVDGTARCLSPLGPRFPSYD
jgi:glycine cleavage system transcriptional repressor